MDQERAYGPGVGDEKADLSSDIPRLYLFTRLLMETGANPP
jgi:hypothetical protein